MIVGTGPMILLGTCESGRLELGWWKPGESLGASIETLLIGIAVETTDETELPSSGEYTNDGICRLVWLGVVCSTAASELLGAVDRSVFAGKSPLLLPGSAS